MIRYVVVGILQGITEFLPISSSGHLVLAQRWLGLDSPGVLFEACLHLGTMAAILIVFRADLASLARALTLRGTLQRRKEIGYLMAATIPIAVAGLLVADRIDALFSSLVAVGAGFLVTAAVLGIAHRLRGRAHRVEARFLDAVLVGLAQALALVPGISRSGTTIATGMAVGLAPDRAARFSFLLAIPALAAAGGLNLWEAARSPSAGAVDWLGIGVGTAVAFLVGLAAVRLLLRMVRHGALWVFALYCAAMGAATLAWATL